MGQVAHALLTRPPLGQKSSLPKEIVITVLVRLACVKHAASVHPEPGSNSHVYTRDNNYLNILSHSAVYAEVLENPSRILSTSSKILQNKL